MENTEFEDLEDGLEDGQEDQNEQEDDSQDITYEQALEWKKQAQNAKKAEKKLVELKKQLKQKPVDTTMNPKEEVKRIMAEEKFFEKNPEAESYRDKIEVYQSKGLSLEDAYLLASRQDKQIEESREVYGKGIIRGDTVSTEGLKLVDVDTYDRMTDSEQSKYNSESKSRYGAVKFK